MCEQTIDGLTSLVDLLAIANKYQVQGLKDCRQAGIRNMQRNGGGIVGSLGNVPMF